MWLMPQTPMEWLGLAFVVVALLALPAIAVAWWRRTHRDAEDRHKRGVTLANLMARERQRWEDAHTTLIKVYDINAKRGRVTQPEVAQLGAVALGEWDTVAIPIGLADAAAKAVPSWASTTTGLRRYLYSGRRR